MSASSADGGAPRLSTAHQSDNIGNRSGEKKSAYPTRPRCLVPTVTEYSYITFPIGLAHHSMLASDLLNQPWNLVKRSLVLQNDAA